MTAVGKQGQEKLILAYLHMIWFAQPRISSPNPDHHHNKIHVQILDAGNEIRAAATSDCDGPFVALPLFLLRIMALVFKG